MLEELVPKHKEPSMRAVIFALEKDQELLKKALPEKIFDPFWVTFKDLEEIPLSGPRWSHFSEIVRDTGAYEVFLPHPVEDPLRLRLAQAVLSSLENRFPRPLRLAFYVIFPKEVKISWFEWQGEPQNFFPHLPLVSVIVRTQNHPLLFDALSSLKEQTYPRLEVLLIWFDNKPKLPSFAEKLDLKIFAGKANRGYNLNLGIQKSKGEFIAFLDEDDLLDPEHFEGLVSVLVNQPSYAVVYSGTRLARWEGDPPNIQRKSVLKIWHEDFDLLRLIFENYIPIHSLLFRKTLFESFSFETRLEAYEDWHFLLNLGLNGVKFLKAPQITAEYRLFEKNLEQRHRNKGFIGEEKKIYDLIFQRIDISKAILNIRPFYFNLINKMMLLEEENKKLKTERQKIKKEICQEKECAKFISRLAESFSINFSSPEKTIYELSSKLLPDNPPSFSILISSKDPPADTLPKLFESLENQSLKNFRLYILDDGSSSKEVKRIVEEKRKKNFWKNKIYFKKTEGWGIVKAYNFLADQAKEEYLVFVDHDDLLSPQALLELSLAAKKKPKLIYSDSDIIDLQDETILTQHKPYWSPETLLCFNYVNHLCVIHQELWKKLGGWRLEYEGAQDWDFLLRTSLEEKDVRHLPVVLYHWRAIKGSVALSPKEKPYVSEAGQKALKDALWKRYANLPLEDISLTPNPRGPGFFFRLQLPKEAWPQVRVIILTPGASFRTQQLVEALVRENYPHLSFTIVSNGRQPLSIKTKVDLKIIELGPVPFNWSFLNNLAAYHSSEEFLLFLNDDIYPKPGFLHHLVQVGLLPNVGLVGACLFFPDGRLQHNGIRLHPEKLASEIRTFGSRGELSVLRNVSAVTGAAMLVRREVFRELGGFNEKLPLNYNDVDFSLRVRQNGLRVVLSPQAEAIHFHMTSREKKNPCQEEREYLKKTWGHFLQDPFWYQWEEKRGRLVKLAFT